MITVTTTKKWLFTALSMVSVIIASLAFAQQSESSTAELEKILIITRVPANSVGNLQFFHKDSTGKPYENVNNLLPTLEENEKTLLFATNGGIFMEDLTPLGLLIENGIQISKPNTIKKAYGNFYLQPNGIFLINQDGHASIVKTEQYRESSAIKYALQSGPMLLLDGQINAIFLPNAESRKIRNGVGLLPSGELIFAKSRRPVTFYDFAKTFQTLGATQALYLDGSISMHYDPSQHQTFKYGKYSVIIGWTAPTNKDEP